jgi:sugar phosphate isomerase/epimerase
VRFRHRDGSTVYLSYCTNVHPAEDVDGVVAQLQRFAGPIREELGVRRLGVGLWLAVDAAAELAADANRRRWLRDTLDDLGLEVVTLNGFPYQAFHAPVVKLAVYEPNWTDPRRADYTIDLATVLVDLLPDDVEDGTISTLPLGWREAWGEAQARAATEQLLRVDAALGELWARTGRRIRVAIEPEPGCIVETTEQAMDVLEDLRAEHVGMCIDTCHLAVQFESPTRAVGEAVRRGVPVAKVQVACALRVADPAHEETLAALGEFDEPRFLHQTRTRSGGGVVGVDDLPEALAGGLPTDDEWRVHFHTAIHGSGTGPLTTSQPELREALGALVGGPVPVTQHLEVETYTWTVLPADRRPSDDAALVVSLAQELTWARDELVALGLEELS